MTLPTDYVDGDVLTAADVNAITLAVNSNTTGKVAVGTFNAKGDLLVGLTNDSVGVLTAGTNGFLLSASSGSSTGLAWTQAGGKLLKVGYFSSANVDTTSSTTYVDSSITLSYTPVSASSYLIVEASFMAGWVVSTANVDLKQNIYRLRNTTSSSTLDIKDIRDVIGSASTDPTSVINTVVLRGVVASSSTSARTYTVQHLTGTATLGSYINPGGAGSALITVYEVEI